MEVKYKFPLFRIGLLLISSHALAHGRATGWLAKPWRQTRAPKQNMSMPGFQNKNFPSQTYRAGGPHCSNPRDVRYFTTMSNGSNYASDMIFKQARHSEI